MNSIDKPLLNVLNGQPTTKRPLWFMRQAGRYLPEYRALRKDAGSFLDLCYNPEKAAEVTLQPTRRFDIDAAILFSDILVIPHALGIELGFVENEGPKLSKVSSQKDIEKLSASNCLEFLQPVFETIKLVKPELQDHMSFIGFCGAPWTVATYMIEGGTSVDRLNAKKAAFSREPWFDILIEKLIDVSIDYLVAQVEAGVEVLQIFDSWASDLPDLERQKYCYEPISKIVYGIRERGVNVPVIGFAKGLGAGQLDFYRNVDVSAVGVESSLPLKWVSENLVPEVVVQGNLDPVLLDIGGPGLDLGVNNIVQSLPKDRHIFNLGHGIRQTTSIDHVLRMIDIVRKYDG